MSCVCPPELVIFAHSCSQRVKAVSREEKVWGGWRKWKLVAEITCGAQHWGAGQIVVEGSPQRSIPGRGSSLDFSSSAPAASCAQEIISFLPGITNGETEGVEGGLEYRKHICGELCLRAIYLI